jgi:hypothetical protein
MKNPNDPIGNRTRNLPPCSAVHHPTAPGDEFCNSAVHITSGKLCKGNRLFFSLFIISLNDSANRRQPFYGFETWPTAPQSACVCPTVPKARTLELRTAPSFSSRLKSFLNITTCHTKNNERSSFICSFLISACPVNRGFNIHKYFWLV